MSIIKRTKALARADKDRMIDLIGGILKARPDVGCFQESAIGKNFIDRCTACQHVQHVFHAQPVAANTRAPAALVRFESDTMNFGAFR